MEITNTLDGLTKSAWREWLLRNHAAQTEVWVLLRRPAVAGCLEYLDAVEEAICFGWIDGIGKRYDDERLAQRFTPRMRRSHWTELNKARARRLIGLGHMTDAGRRVLPALQTPLVIADDVRAALQERPGVWPRFSNYPELYRRVRISYVEEARRNTEEFRRRLTNLVAKTEAGKMYGNWNDGGRLGAS